MNHVDIESAQRSNAQLEGRSGVLARAEDALAGSIPFGDCEYIVEYTVKCYQRRIQMLAEVSPSAAALSLALERADAEDRERVACDPIVRALVNQALGHVKLNLRYEFMDELTAVLDTAVRHLDERAPTAPLQTGAPLSPRLPGARRACAWTETRADDAPSRAFRRAVTGHLPALQMLEPDAAQRDNLDRGAQILKDLLPHLGPSALRHVEVIVVSRLKMNISSSRGHSEGGFKSFTTPSFPGAVFLSPAVLGTPWAAAEHLLHEAMHLKFIELENTHSMFKRGYRAENSPTIRPAWHRAQAGRRLDWTIGHATTVMHVYTSLALFFMLVERRAGELERRYGSLGGMAPAQEARRALDRARFLGTQLQRHQAELGTAGRQFVGWLEKVLRSLDRHPRLDGAYIHLAMDLYDREARQLEERISSADDATLGVGVKPGNSRDGDDEVQIAEALRRMFFIESEKLREVWSVLGQPEMPSSETRLGPSMEETDDPRRAVASLCAVRGWIASQLDSIPPAMFERAAGGKEGRTVGDIVREMIDGSGVYVDAILPIFGRG